MDTVLSWQPFDVENADAFKFLSKTLLKEGGKLSEKGIAVLWQAMDCLLLFVLIRCRIIALYQVTV